MLSFFTPLKTGRRILRTSDLLIAFKPISMCLGMPYGIPEIFHFKNASGVLAAAWPSAKRSSTGHACDPPDTYFT